MSETWSPREIAVETTSKRMANYSFVSRPMNLLAPLPRYHSIILILFGNNSDIA